MRRDMKCSRHLNKVLLSSVSLVSSLFLVLANQAFAASTEDKNIPSALSKSVRGELTIHGKMPAAEDAIFGEHHQPKALNPAQRKGIPADDDAARVSYGSPPSKHANLLKRPSSLDANKSKAQLQAARGTVAPLAADVPAPCDRQIFADATGAALVNLVKTSTVLCVNNLFKTPAAQANAIFKESQMVTIANAFNTSAASYNATNADSTLQLVLFLRAGYYVQYSQPAAVGTYGTSLKTAMRSAMDAFANNGNFLTVSDAHGEILSEFVTMVDSANENARYLDSVVKRLLVNYKPTHNNFKWMRSATNNVFNILYMGHYRADFQALVQSDSSIVDTLYNFADANFNLLGGTYGYLVANAGWELGRFLQYANTTGVKTLAKSRSKQLLDRSNVVGTTAAMWVGVGQFVDYYDKANCSYYNLCDFAQRMDTQVLTISHSCSPTLRLRAQSLTPAQLQEACTSVGAEETKFHNEVASGKVPVANDNNTQLEMVIYSDSKNYKLYAGAMYGIGTNNGGMYLEGNPSVAGNQARFLAYQAEWLMPNFEIWNLTHEYIHYLDGRFNMFGDFTASTAPVDIWWIEGFAEYMSYSFRQLNYEGANTQAAAATYNLSEIFKNTYNSDQTRIYNWGYLAVRYMFEKQRSKVSSLLGYFRPGNYSGYTSYMSSLGTSMDADFKAWLPCVNNPTLTGCVINGNQLPVASYTSSSTGLTASFSDTSIDRDGTIASRLWSFGDRSVNSTEVSPSHTFAAAGTYTVTLTVTDNNGGKALAQKAVVVTGTPTPPANLAPVSKFGSSATNLVVNFTDLSTDSDGSIVSRAWNFGDGTSSTATNVTKTYGAAGTYLVSLTVTDDKAAQTTSSQSIVVTAPVAFPECTGSAQAMGKNCVRSNLSSTAGNYKYMYIYIPAGTPSLRITASGGTGNADLYFNKSAWATKTAFTNSSVNAGNNETITIANPPSGYLYISLYGVNADNGFSGVRLLTEY